MRTIYQLQVGLGLLFLAIAGYLFWQQSLLGYSNYDRLSETSQINFKYYLDTSKFRFVRDNVTNNLKITNESSQTISLSTNNLLSLEAVLQGWAKLEVEEDSTLLTPSAECKYMAISVRRFWQIQPQSINDNYNFSGQEVSNKSVLQDIACLTNLPKSDNLYRYDIVEDTTGNV